MSKLTFSLILSQLLIVSNSAWAVVNGELASDSIYNAVGALRLGKEKGVGCTATVIDEKWIVTAQHCTAISNENEEGGELAEEGSGSLLSASNFEFRLGADFKKPIFKSKVKRWVTFDYEESEDLQLDVAFGELATAVPLKKLNIRAIPLSQQKWTPEDLKASYIHIGYGQRTAFSANVTPWNGARQLARFVVTSTSGNALLQLFKDDQNLKKYIERFHPQIDLENEPLESIVYNGELVKGSSVHAWDPRGRTDLQNVSVPNQGWQDTCFGDSGGPLLRQVDGQLQVVGVVSSGMNRVCENFGTRFSIFGAKVRSLMRRNGIK